jgi:hypothetical protein
VLATTTKHVEIPFIIRAGSAKNGAIVALETALCCKYSLLVFSNTVCGFGDWVALEPTFFGATMTLKFSSISASDDFTVAMVLMGKCVHCYVQAFVRFRNPLLSHTPWHVLRRLPNHFGIGPPFYVTCFKCLSANSEVTRWVRIGLKTQVVTTQHWLTRSPHFFLE